MAGSDGFVDAMLESPVGVALLARLETRVRNSGGYGRLANDTSPEFVHATSEAVAQMSFGELVELAVFTATIDAGPWIPDAPDTVAASYRHAEERAPIAAAINDRFGSALHAPMDHTRQQWWTTERNDVGRLAPLFVDFGHVYDAGQFTWAGLWTVSDPPAIAHSQLIDSWELYDGPITRWNLPVVPSARVFEIHRPDDWVHLIREHPREASSHLEHWELPGINQDQDELSTLMAAPAQRAARTTIRHHVVPDWRSVADHYDGVHLSWAGFITSEGCITDHDNGDVAMLRYWFSERTHWLSDVFGDPEPAPPPSLHEPQLSDGSAGTVDQGDRHVRRRRDAQNLGQLLGR